MAVKERVGIVVSDKMKDSCVVAVTEKVIHKTYKKVITKTKSTQFMIPHLIPQWGIKFLFAKQNR